MEQIGFEHAPIGLVVARNRRIERCNALFCEMFGYTRAELEGQSLAILYPSKDEFQRIGTLGTKAMLIDGRYDDERIMARKGGRLFWCRVRGQSLTPDDPLAHSVWSWADLSENRPLIRLSRRERQVAMLLCEGKTSKEIARDLDISPRTVESHRANMIGKLGARNSTDLVVRLTGMPV
ncbi:MAG: PAS and helix-turn-helix domain-containing protein [Alphaproteobacteria bacterium]|nr:PAS and helix-turn-helix domain-containing protein [Alphaproteobacteria bacterium]